MSSLNLMKEAFLFLQRRRAVVMGQLFLMGLLLLGNHLVSLFFNVPALVKRYAEIMTGEVSLAKLGYDPALVDCMLMGASFFFIFVLVHQISTVYLLSSLRGNESNLQEAAQIGLARMIQSSTTWLSFGAIFVGVLISAYLVLEIVRNMTYGGQPASGVLQLFALSSGAILLIVLLWLGCGFFFAQQLVADGTFDFNEVVTASCRLIRSSFSTVLAFGTLVVTATLLPFFLVLVGLSGPLVDLVHLALNLVILTAHNMLYEAVNRA